MSIVGDCTPKVALHVRAQHAEGPLWDGETSRLWWVDITGERVHCFDPRASCDRSWEVHGQPGGVVLTASGEPLVASPGGLSLLDRDTGQLHLRVPIEADETENRANDVKIDDRGSVWVGTMAYDKRPRHGALYRVEADEVWCVVDGLTVPNGPAFDEPRNRLYLADTALGLIYLFHLDPETRGLSACRPFVDLSAAGVWPDGMAVDDEGFLWVAVGRAGAVHCYRPDGSLEGTIDLPTTNPTSVAFGGPDGGDLYITTSWSDLEADDRSTEELAGAIFCCRPGTAGHARSRCADTERLRAEPPRLARDPSVL